MATSTVRLRLKSKRILCLDLVTLIQHRVLGHLRYSFVSNPLHESTARELAEIITEYGEHSRSFGDYSSLVIFFELDETRKQILDYELIFWNLLSQISDLDNKPWPEDIPKDPERAQWEFCYNDERYFVYCSTPAHISRKSRNLTYFMLALTPRWVLNQWNANPQKAAATAPRIRTRLAAPNCTESEALKYGFYP